MVESHRETIPFGYGDCLNKLLLQLLALSLIHISETFYSYDPQRRRLQNLVVNAKAGTIMDLSLIHI